MARKIFLYGLVMITLLSCLDDADCTVEGTTVVNIAFIKKSLLEADTLEFVNITLEGSDSIFYEKDTTESISLPINTHQTQMPITMNLEDGSSFHLTLQYGVVPRLISEDCGLEFRIEGLTIASHDFDSVALVDPSLEDEITTNVELYR